MNSQLVKQLISSRKSLKAKYKSLKSDVAKSQSSLEKSYKPITEPLQELITSIKQSNVGGIKQEPKEESEGFKTSIPALYRTFQQYYQTVPEDNTLAPDETFLYEPSLNPEESYFDDDLQRPRTSQELQEKQLQEYLNQFAPLPRAYIDDIFRLHSNMDHTFGVYFNPDLDKFMIGKSPIKFDGPNFIIGDMTYPGTVGLYELMFKKTPSGYKPADLDNYLDIIRRNNVQYLDYDPERGINTSSNPKFMNIIKPNISTINFLTKQKELQKEREKKEREKDLSPTKKSSIPTFEKRILRPRLGSDPTLSSTRIGKNLDMMKLNNKKIEYIYFDDPNEIVDRLRLLIASQSAGNTSHNNEIISIIEELREAKIIA